MKDRAHCGAARRIYKGESLRTRRHFLKTAAFAAASAVAPFPRYRSALAMPAKFQSRRPPVSERKFVSQTVERTIAEIKAAMADEELAWLFENCFPNTLDTTVRFSEKNGKPDTFVITGDIPAMWLRDSTAQVWPYLPLAQDDKALRLLLAGVINRQAQCILIDPYANAFNDGPGDSYWKTDLTDMKPELHERKWEIDSLCYPIRLAHGYWKATGDVSCFDDDWRRAASLAVKTFKEQQRFESRGPYKFQRNTPVWSDTVPMGGYGNPTLPNGMIHSMFRPSDDSCIFPFLVPANLFAATALSHLAEISATVWRDENFASECRNLFGQIKAAVAKYAVVAHPNADRIYAYEIDGFGNALFMDDANIPSLLSLPYLGCCAVDDAVYQNTRRFVLSESNPYFHRGKAAEGVGSPHVGLGMIWPLAIIMRALTSQNDDEILACLKMLKTTHAGTGFMHEAFEQDDPQKFTRAWFAWANTLFGEMILKLRAERPHLLKSKI
jgi:meiotically up-regulated gene 157 (Mug157) protein